MTTKPVPLPSLQKLLDLAEDTRPDLDRDVLQGVLVGYRDAGTPWRKLMVQTVLMLAHGDDVRELRAALNDPTKPRRA